MRNYSIRKRILVTGGAGIIGSHLCERLLAGGSDVLCVDNFFTGAKDNIAHLIGNPHFELMSHDVTFPLFVEVDEIYSVILPTEFAASSGLLPTVRQSRREKSNRRQSCALIREHARKSAKQPSASSARTCTCSVRARMTRGVAATSISTSSLRSHPKRRCARGCRCWPVCIGALASGASTWC